MYWCGSCFKISQIVKLLLQFLEINPKRKSYPKTAYQVVTPHAGITRLKTVKMPGKGRGLSVWN